jgi:hypothetical protein
LDWAFFVFASQAFGEAFVVAVAAWFDRTIINVMASVSNLCFFNSAKTYSIELRQLPLFLALNAIPRAFKCPRF